MKPIVSGEVIHDDFAANLALHEDASSNRLVELLSLVQSFDEGLVGIGGFRAVRATAGRRSSTKVNEVSSLGWLPYETPNRLLVSPLARTIYALELSCSP